MQNAFLLFVAVFLLSGCTALQPDEPKKDILQHGPEPVAGIATEIVAENLDIPWGIAFLSDGQLVFTERAGKVKLLDKGVVHEVAGVVHLGESGLQGIAVDPNFKENGFVYLYYTYSRSNGLFNRVSRFILSNNTLEKETVILENIPGNVFHDGGRIRFGPDGKLYVATGDAGKAELAQDLNSLAGKILRLNPDGSVPADNPFGSLVYSFGHRNSQGFDWHPETGVLLATEHGSSKRDEVNLIIKGNNYGWPLKLCNEGIEAKAFVEALLCFDEWTLAPSGAAFYSGNKLQLKNHFIYTGLRGEQLRVLSLENGKILSDKKLLDGFGRIRDVVQGPDGWLYFATNNTDGRGSAKPGDDRIYRITAK